ncbi:MAG: DUF1643 domain-containing protein [SAR324 cluster bacterium]
MNPMRAIPPVPRINSRIAQGPAAPIPRRAARLKSPQLLRHARFSRCGRYRYTLTRAWGAGGTVAFVMLNPSTADGTRDDATIRRCIGLARGWGYGGIEVVNLFAWRATQPRDLRRAAAPEGPGNRRALWAAIGRAEAVVLAWGNDGAWRDAGARLLRRLTRVCPDKELECLGWTRLGHPRHVLYVRNDVQRRRIFAANGSRSMRHARDVAGG